MLRRTLFPLLGLLLLSAQPSATWSIVCVNTRTREVGVASATCIESFNLRTAVPVIFAGEGAAAAQSFVDSTGENRRLIYFSFRDTEETPAEILARLALQDPGHETRQYGIVNFAGDPVTFTGSRAGSAASGVTGAIGDYLYAIQGNILTGDEVVFAAEAAFRAQKGDMGQRMMAAMEAARALGGDGRCSCTSGPPTSCGVPPPEPFKSAHVGVIVVARVGDANGGCSSARGCANGEYHLNLNVIGNSSDPDPVFTLQKRYDLWREHLLGRPDADTSRLLHVKALPADGETVRTIVIELRDIDDHRITHGGAQIEISTVDGLPSLAEVGPVTDHGDGTYSFPLTAGTVPGVDRFHVRVTDLLPGDPEDVVAATLTPPLEIATLATALYAGEESVSSALGGHVPFVLNRPDKPRASYCLVARLVPSERGEALRLLPGGFPVLPIGQSPFFPGGTGALDERGRGEAALDLPPGLLAPLIGRRVECRGYVLDGGALEVTNAAGFEVVP